MAKVGTHNCGSKNVAERDQMVWAVSYGPKKVLSAKKTFGVSQRVFVPVVQVRMQNSRYTTFPSTSRPTYRPSERNILHDVPTHQPVGRTN